MIQSQSAILVVSISAHPILCWGAVCYAGCIESAETDMADELNVNEYMAYLRGLTSGAIRGIIDNGEQMRENAERIPVVDDGTLLEVAAFIAVADIDSNPRYSDDTKFEGVPERTREKRERKRV